MHLLVFPLFPNPFVSEYYNVHSLMFLFDILQQPYLMLWDGFLMND